MVAMVVLPVRAVLRWVVSSCSCGQLGCGRGVCELCSGCDMNSHTWAAFACPRVPAVSNLHSYAPPLPALCCLPPTSLPTSDRHVQVSRADELVAIDSICVVAGSGGLGWN